MIAQARFVFRGFWLFLFLETAEQLQIDYLWFLFRLHAATLFFVGGTAAFFFHFFEFLVLAGL